MKKLALLLFLPFILSCSKQVYTVPEYHVHKVQRPNKPVLLQLNEKKHIGHPSNIDALIQNITRLINYSEALENVVDKYEIQADEAN